jgi:hypothetical protein
MNKINPRFSATFFSLLIMGALRLSLAGEIVGKVTGDFPEGLSGTIAYVNPQSAKVIEVDRTGEAKTAWTIPASYQLGGSLFSGADIEWVVSNQTYLVTIPRAAVIESTREGKVVWSYKTKYISHDADRLTNGNTIFTNGWDADQDPIVTEVSSAGVVVREIFASDLGLSKEDWKPSTGEPYSNTHANAVQVEANLDTIISLRNYNMFVVVRDGKVIERFKNIRLVHDPVSTERGYFYARHGQTQWLGWQSRVDGERRKLFEAQGVNRWTPLRSVQPLMDNKYILITGSTAIGILDSQGNLVWSLDLDGFSHQKNGKTAGTPFLFKAVFIPD